MSETLHTAEDDTPRRARPERAEALAGQRRRRRANSLDRMAGMKLDIFSRDQLDLANWVYLWANDEGTNIRQLTVNDDYEFCTSDDIIGGFDRDQTDSESDDRIRILAGYQKSGAPLYTYYLKKPRAFWEADQDEMVSNREDMMAGRVYRNDATEEAEQRPGGEEVFYASKTNQIGHAAQRRRGPVPRNLK